MLERVSVPRRALDFEDYVDILRRNFRWILGPAFAGLVVSTVVAFLMQDTYVSTALLRIVPQQISDTLVQNASSQQIEDHINAMAEQIESRDTLSNIINQYHLYPSEMKSEPQTDVINTMKTAITIRPTAGITDMTNQHSIPAMQVAFKYRDRYLAQKVCDELVSRFLSQSASESMQHTDSATQFLHDEAEQAHHELEDWDKKLSDFRQRNAGHLPEEMELNIQQMNALSQQENALSDALNRNTERRMLLESNLQIAKSRLAAIKDITPQSQAHDVHLEDLNNQIDKLKTDIANMKDHYTDDFPDLVSARQQLAVLEKERDEAQKEKPKETGTPQMSREKLDAQSAVDAVQAQIQANALEAQQIQKQLGVVRSQAQVFQGRAEEAPAGEKEYLELINGRDLAKTHYDELETKLEKASLSTDLQRRKQGETMEVLDAPSLPDTPTAPKRPMIISIGPAIGLIIGLIIAAIREVKDTSLKNLKDARLYTQLTILGSIPLLENDLVVQRRKQMTWVSWAAATLVGLAIMGITIAHYYMTKA